MNNGKYKITNDRPTPARYAENLKEAKAIAQEMKAGLFDGECSHIEKWCDVDERYEHHSSYRVR